MTHGSLFSGIGGFDLAAEWMGWENKFHCEWNPFGQRVAKYYWPDAESFNDITKTDFKKYEGRIDVLTGGFPCQPYSKAGKRRGKDDERHLWPHMLRAIREIRPRWVVGENVRGLVNWSNGLVFEEIKAELEAEGFRVFPVVLPAAGVNAIHRRERIFFIAHSDSNGQHRCDSNGQHRCDSKYEIDAGERRINALYDSQQIFTSYTMRRKSEIGRNDGRMGWELELGSQTSRAGETVIECTICDLDDGISAGMDFGSIFEKPKSRKSKTPQQLWHEESLKAMGNAVVPQVALQIFRVIEQMEILF